MNTNLVVTLLVMAVTNWTGHMEGTNELGLIKTNHVARIEYAGTTNELTLLSVDSGQHVWRTYPYILQATNEILIDLWTNITLTPYMPEWRATTNDYLLNGGRGVLE